MRDNLIHLKAEFIIKDGKLKEYKKLVRKMSKLAEANEPGTLGYYFYFNKGQGEKNT
jgi:hypothetical protein